MTYARRALVGALCCALMACGGPVNSAADEDFEESSAQQSRQGNRRAQRGGEEDDEEEGEAPEGRQPRERAPREEFVLLPDDAWVYTAPDEQATKARVVARTRGGWNAFALKVVETRPGWLGVETLDAREEPRHCAPTIPGFRALRVRLWVRDTSLAGVVTRRARVEYEDGSSVALSPGARVEPIDGLSNGDRTVFTAYTNGAVTNLVLGPEAVGVRYTPERALLGRLDDGSSPSVESVIPAETELRVGGVLLAREPISESWATRPWRVLSAPVRARARRRGGSVAIALQTRCGSFNTTAPAASVTPEAAQRAVPVAPAPVEGLRARAGAFVFWPDGRRAGRVREAVHFDMLEGEDARGFPCVRQGLGASYNPERDRRSLHGLRLCIAPGDLEGR